MRQLLFGFKFGVVAISALVATACAAPSAAEDPQIAPQYGPMAEVPAEYLGDWKLTSQECYADVDVEPDQILPDRTIRFSPDHRYELVEAEHPSSGTFTVNRYVDGSELTLDDTMRQFVFANGRLENWSEGDAAYVCGGIYTQIEADSTR